MRPRAESRVPHFADDCRRIVFVRSTSRSPPSVGQTTSFLVRWKALTRGLLFRCPQVRSDARRSSNSGWKVDMLRPLLMERNRCAASPWWVSCPPVWPIAWLLHWSSPPNPPYAQEWRFLLLADVPGQGLLFESRREFSFAFRVCTNGRLQASPLKEEVEHTCLLTFPLACPWQGRCAPPQQSRKVRKVG